MSKHLSNRRLQVEYKNILRQPIDNIVTHPLETNILDWHYVLTGQDEYAGGLYHGVLRFPREYPLKPPAIMMFTPNGRFKTGTRLCLSISDFHPDTWSPTWCVDKILLGLQSFMLEKEPTQGSIETSTADKLRFAAESLEFNCRDANFRKLFPELVELHETRKAEAQSQDAGDMPVKTVDSESDSGLKALAL